MKKICILQNSLTYGGTDTFVINLSHGLVRDGYDVTVILSMDESAKEYAPREEELLSTGAHILWTCPLQKGITSKLHHLSLLYRELKKGQYDVFQTNIDLFNGPQMLVAWLAGVPVRECHSHNSEQGIEVEKGRTVLIRLYQKIMRWLCWAFSNRRGGCSSAAMDFLFGAKWKNDQHSKIVHNGIDFSEYNIPFDKSEKAVTLGLTEKYNICTVGRISYQKNPLFIVEVMNELFKLRHDCDFVWIGTGDLKDEVLNKIKGYGIEDRMHMLGYRTDVAEILRSCDAFFLPSHFEGLGIVLIEAQAAGLPCLISDVVPDEADCGLCLPFSLEKSAAYWAKQLDDILDKKVNLRVKQIRLEQYSIDYMVSEMEGLFES